MKHIKYILVNESSSENAGRAIRDCKFTDIRQHLIVETGGLSDGSRVQGSRYKDLEQRQALINELLRLRRHYPDAKILGVSELGEYCVHTSERMNQLRRELSELGEQCELKHCRVDESLQRKLSDLP